MRIKVGLQDFMHKHGPNMLQKLFKLSYLDCTETFRSSTLFLDYPDTFSRLTGHLTGNSPDYQDTPVDHPDSF